MKKSFQMLLLSAFTLMAVAVFAKSEGTEVSVVTMEQSAFAIHAPTVELVYFPSATGEVVPFFTPEVIGSECEGFTDDVYHPPLKDCIH